MNDIVFTPPTPEEKADLVAASGGPINRVSFSTMKKFESCPYAVFLSKVKRCEEPSSEAADRGSAIHDLAEQCIRDNWEEIPSELARFKDTFRRLQRQFFREKVELEEEWGFTRTWTPVAWSSQQCWLMMKLDVFVREDETSALVIDWKTGKKDGNEIKHGDQCLLYALGAFARYPDLELVTTQLYYLDKGQTLEKIFTRQRAELFHTRYQDRLLAVTQAQEFAPKPSISNCRFCPHRETGNCEWAVSSQ